MRSNSSTLEPVGHTQFFSDGKQVLGSFAISSPQPQSPPSVEIQILETVSSLAGIAIQRREKEQALSDSELRYRTLYEDNPSMYFTVALDGTVLSVNQFGANQLGYTVQELLQQPVWILFPEEDHALVKQRLKECLEMPTKLAHWEFRKIRKDGKVIWVRESVRVVKNQDNQSVFLIVCEDVTQKKQAEGKIQEMNMALSNAMPGIAQINPKGIYLEVNTSYAAMLRYHTDELIGTSWEPTVHPEDRPSAFEAYEVMLKTGKGEFEAKAVRKDGSTFYKHVLMVKKVDANGALIGHHCFMRDITERKVADEALRESEARLQDILDNSPAVIYVKDFQGHYSFINREYERIFNLKREQVKGKTDFDLFSYEIAKAFTDNDKKVLNQGVALESEEVAPHKDGPHLYLSNKFPLRNAEGTTYALCGISSDITQRKQAEMNISLHNHILESSPNGILITDSQKPDDPITYCNAALEKMTGYTQEEVLGRNCRFLQKDDRDQEGLATIRSAISKEQECEVVVRNYKKDGTLFWNDLRLAPVFDDKRQLIHYIGVLTDITEQKLAESQLRQAYDQTRELSVRLEAAEESERKRIARELHDEFGQMLTGLKFDLSWLERRLSEQPSLTSYSVVLGKTRSMTNLTDDLIHMVRRIATSLRPSILDDLGLVPALEWHTNDFQTRTGIKCTFSSELQGHQESLASEQATALFRIAQELFTNILRHAEASHVKLVLKKNHEFLTLSVRDDGRGLDDHSNSQLPSLGLLGIRERVTSFGGDFQIQGKSGKGTLATVRLPLAEKQPA